MNVIQISEREESNANESRDEPDGGLIRVIAFQYIITMLFPKNRKTSLVN